MDDPIIENDVLVRIRSLTPQQKRRLMTSVEAARIWCPKITNANWHLLIDAVENESKAPTLSAMDDLLGQIEFIARIGSVDELKELRALVGDAVAHGAVSVVRVRTSFVKAYAFVDRHGHTVADW